MLRIDVVESHEAVAAIYQGRLVDESIITEFQRLDEEIHRFNKTEGRDEHGNPNYIWSGYCKIYINQYENGEHVARYRLDLGDGVKANSRFYEFLSDYVK